MIALLRRAFLGEPAPKAQDARAKRIDENEIKLRNWGFGPQRTADKCRERLQGLCKFLLELDRENGSEDHGKSQIRKLKSAFEKAESLETSRDGHIRYLEDLLLVLADLIRKNEAGSEETAAEYLKRLKGWSLEALLNQQRPDIRPEQRKALEKSLTILRTLSADRSTPEEQPLVCLESLHTDLETLGTGCPDDIRARVRQCFEDCVGDWEWAHLQVRIRLARLLLEKEPDSEKAAEHLEEAIERLEDKELFQARFEGLYGRLAGNYLIRAQSKEPDPKKRLDLLYRALAYAQHAVELEPESARERLRLIEVFSALGDEEEMKIEAEIALNLEPSSADTLKTVGKSFWDRISSLHDRKRRRKVLDEAIQFFRNALALAESDRFSVENPREQMQTHGWAHYWLGQFQCESGRYGESVSHLQTARSLGFKPLESGVELAWAYLLAKDHQKAEEAFSKMAEEVKNPEGQEIGDLKLRIHLGRAFLWAGRDPKRARDEAKEVRAILNGKNKADKNKADFEAALYEVCGLAYLQEDRTAEGVAELEKAIRLSPRSGAYCALASVKLEEARISNGTASQIALRQAREAWQLARDHDVRGHHRREIRDLLRQLQQLEEPNGSAAKPPSKPAAKPAEKAAEKPSSPS